jgi:hypothetical protein
MITRNFAHPCHTLCALSVDISHQSYLGSLLFQVPLVDADLINPQVALSRLMSKAQ